MIADLLRPRRILLAATALLFLLAQALDTLPPLIIGAIVDGPLTRGDTGALWSLAWLYFGATVGTRAMNGLAIYLTAVAAQSALHDLRVTLFRRLQRLPMRYYDRTPLGDIISRGTADVETVDALFTSGVATLVSSLFSLVTISIALAFLSLPLTLLTALLTPVVVVITQFFRLRVREAENANRVSLGLVNTHLQEILGGIEVIRAFGREHTFIARFRAALHRNLLAYNRATAYNSFYPPLMSMLSSLIAAGLLWLGASNALASLGVSIGTLTAFVLLFRRFFAVLIDLGDEWQTVQSALSGLQRIREVLSEPVDVILPAAPMPANAVPGAVTLDGVTFGYLDGRPVLHGLSLAVGPGEHVAVVGRTGAGKTSALHLLAGLYAPWTGTVRVAGRDPAAVPPDGRRRLVGVVPQQVQLFGGTVHDNLTLGDTAVPRADVERAARIAGADAFIRALPQGYDTPLSGAGRGGGAQLSAGQRQLLALARALVWNPQLLLLDEATAAVDNASEAAFRESLRADLSAGRRAVVTVAHRLSTAREADRVIVMEAGRVVEEGAPRELIARGGRFAALVELEAAGWDWQAT
ncbi:MAG: ABC transporter ATP-binding protein [Chloroflexi bacterium]|nr:ABC transporter ATP-binding protein [Chloroflexota bacterium]